MSKPEAYAQAVAIHGLVNSGHFDRAASELAAAPLQVAIFVGILAAEDGVAYHPSLDQLLAALGRLPTLN
jgi:hypothetical protein